MTKQTFTLCGRLPGYNDLKERNDPWGRVKKLAMRDVWAYARAGGLKKINVPAKVHIRCFEKNKRRDVDNVTSGAAKVILDSFQRYGFLENDNAKHIVAVTYEVDYDKDNPRIEVEIREVEGC